MKKQAQIIEFKLPEKCPLAQVEKLHEQLKALAAEDTSMTDVHFLLDARALREASTASAQLLMSLAEHLHLMDGQLVLIDPDAMLDNFFARMGSRNPFNPGE